MATHSSISCLENPMDRGTWWATVHGVTKCQTRLKGLNTQYFGWGGYIALNRVIGQRSLF